ncbi:hypothetical protein COMA1_11448 [Candidatus Nitrospira nitrosa]|uniref:Uncharacterized protein n=1 Tax=Candidatus Nitrospira nitrosa TaxID=1742972 RepID=A0A0S4LDG6_9BACT|nr:hypothetical protein COMA1_11448 [Candidatus Nitrospira nitrosa]
MLKTWLTTRRPCQMTQYTDALFGPAIYNALSSAFEFVQLVTL